VEGNFRIEEYNDRALPSTVLTLTQLQSLTLGSTPYTLSNAVPMGILNCLNTPALKSLNLSFPLRNAWYNDFNVSPFLAFVSRSSFQLHTLGLSLIPATTGSLIQCLRATPSLTHFKLKPLDLDINSFFRQLIGHPHILPHLESFHLVFPFPDISGATSTTPSIIIQMLRWRWSAVGIARLQSFRLAHDISGQYNFRWQRTYQSTLVEDVKLQGGFRELKEEGMVLYAGGAVAPIDTF